MNKAICHVCLVGERGVGKSTLIRRVLAELQKPVFGFETRKEPELSSECGIPVYIYRAGSVRSQSQKNLIGFCKQRHLVTFVEAIDRFAPNLHQSVPSDGIILMDELGFMEAASDVFCRAVIELFDGDIPVLAAVKPKSIPFLDAVRTHTKVKCFYITEQNRDKLFYEIVAFLKESFRNQELRECKEYL